MSHSVAKNTLFFISALVIQKILAFGFFIFIARTVGGVAGTGDYVGALSFATIFSILLELGFSQVIIRETAKKPEQGSNYLNNIISFKITLAVFVYIALFLVVKGLDLADKNHPNTLMIMIAGLVMVSDSFVLSLQATLRGYQNLFYESLITVVSKIVIIIVGFLGIRQGYPPYIFIVAILFGSVLSLIMSVYYLVKKFKYRFHFYLDKKVLKPFLKMSIPFAILGLFTNIYSQIDVVILSIIKGSEAVGFYSVTSKTLNALQFVPMAFSASLYPAMSRYFYSDKKSLVRIFEKGFNYLTLVCVPMAVGIFILSEPIIISAYGEIYRDSVLALKILAPSLVFAFLTFPVGALLNAGNRQKINTINMGIIMVINIVLNLILVPKMSFMGSAWAWFFTNVIWFFLTIYWAGKLIDYNIKSLFINFLKSVFAAFIMGVVLLQFNEINVLINVALGGFTYLVVIGLIGGIKISEAKELLFSFKKNK